MGEPLSLQVAELSLVEGERRSNPPEMAWAETERGVLYVLVELSAPAELWDEVGELLVESAIEGFMLTDGSDSLALNRATEAVNRALQLENEELPREDQVWAGLNMALLRTGTVDLYLAQAGPALTYLARDRRYKQFPEAESSSLPAPQPAPLGDTGHPRVRLAKFTLEPNDVVVLSATHLPQIVSSEEQMRRAITTGDAHEVATALAGLAAGHDYSALILHPTVPRRERPAADADEPAAATQETPAAATPSVPEQDDSWWYGEVAEDEDDDRKDPEPQPTEERPSRSKPSRPKQPDREPRPSSQSTGRASSAGGRSHEGTASTEQNRADRQGTGSAPERRRSVRPRTPRVQQPKGPSRVEQVTVRLRDWAADTRDLSRDLMARASLKPLRRVLSLVGAFLLLVVAWVLRLIDWGLQAYSRFVLPALRKLIPFLDRAALLLVAGLVWVWRHFVAVVRHMLPGVTPADESSRDIEIRAPSEDGRTLFPVLAVLIPLLILLTATGWYWSTSDGDGERYDALVTDVRTSVEQAEQADPNAAIILLQDVEENLAEAAAIRPNAEEVQALEARYNAILERVAKVQRIAATQIASLSAEAQPGDIVLQDGTLYVLDRASGNVYTVDPANPPSTPLDQSGAPLMGPGKPADGPIYFITRMPPGGTRSAPAVVGLTETGVVEYSEQNGVRALQFTPVSGSIVAIDHYAGNLYLLDRANTQIWKYEPDVGGEYSSQPEGWIEASTRENLANLIEFAIDGDIYVIDDDGTVVKMSVGERQPFTLEAPLPALSTAVALFTDEPARDEPLEYLYVAEPERLLVYDKSGALIVQYRAPTDQEWGDIVDVVADEADGTIYLLTTQSVLRLPLQTEG